MSSHTLPARSLDSDLLNHVVLDPLGFDNPVPHELDRHFDQDVLGIRVSRHSKFVGHSMLLVPELSHG